MKLEGVIAELYETWPLQLSLKTPRGPYLVSLSDQTRVVHKKQSIPASQLKPGMRVQISGAPSGKQTLVAQSISIQ